MGKFFGFSSNKTVYLAGALLVMMGAWQVYVSARKTNPLSSPAGTGPYRVVLGAQGFEPKDLIVPQGTAVTFETTLKEPFWPASDPHPTHVYLPDFDPKAPVSPGDSWRYAFQKPGTWAYHDHLHLYFHGTITVLPAQASEGLPTASSSAYCEGECFDRLVRETVRTKGIDAAYALFTSAYAAGKLPRTCHWTAHQIGEEAYNLFRKGIDFPISRATSYCGYGFYHGFMEKLLRENPSVDYALSFCKRVEEKLGKMGLWNCYHGIGHGFTEDPPPPETVGHPDAMLKPGIKMCEYLFGSSFFNLNLCLTGVYTVIAGFSAKHEYGLSMNPDDPFAFCRTQPYRYHKACYGEFTPKLVDVPGWDLDKLPPLLANIDDDRTKRLVTWVTPSVLVSKDILQEDLSHHILDCRRNFSGRYKNICIGGVMVGVFGNAQPGKQYEKGLTLCKSPVLLDDERERCYAELFHRMRQEYDTDKVKTICETMPEQYRARCTDANLYTPAYDDPSFDVNQ